MERSSSDPDTLIITYEGLHLHFAYPLSVFGQTHQESPPVKKPKNKKYEAQKSPTKCNIGLDPITHVDHHLELAEKEERISQGLLQDMVPLMILKPSSNNASSNSPCSSHRSPPNSSPSQSQSQSWPPNYYYYSNSYFDTFLDDYIIN